MQRLHVAVSGPERSPRFGLLAVLVAASTVVFAIAGGGTASASDTAVTSTSSSFPVIEDGLVYMSTAGGTVVDLNGNNFGTAEGTVTVGSRAAKVDSWSSTLVTITAPAGIACAAEDGCATDIVLTTADGETATDNSSVFYLNPPPPMEIVSVSPANGPTTGGQQLTIMTNEDGAFSSTSTFSVTIGGVSAPATAIAGDFDQGLVVAVPAGDPGPASLVVRSEFMTVLGTYTRTASTTFTYDAPVISSISPASGPTAGGQLVTIAGANFGKDTGTVSVGGASAPVDSWTHTQVVITTPAGDPGSAPLILKAAGGQQATATFTYDAPVKVALSSAANPSAVGTAVTFTVTAVAASGTAVPTGLVQFKVDGSDLGAPVQLADGNATSAAVSSLSAGGHTVTADFAGSFGFAPASAALTQVVTKSPCASLANCNLRGENLSGADLSSADLSGANLAGADLQGANLSGAKLGNDNLRAANLSGSTLTSVDLSGANLAGADLQGANLSGADLRNANLARANLTSADLDSAVVTEANFRRVTWSAAICPDGTDSSNDGGTCAGHL